MTYDEPHEACLGLHTRDWFGDYEPCLQCARIRAAVDAARADERRKAEMHDYHMPAWAAGLAAALDPEQNKRMHAMTREDAIRDCIAVVEHLHDHEAPHDSHRDALWNAVVALRALLEGSE